MQANERIDDVAPAAPQPAPITEAASARPMPRWSLRQTFAALSYPNYRLWFFGQLVSLLGTWMQTTAQGFLMFELTKSPLYLGYVGFAAGVPSWALMLYGGVVADRFDRRKLLVVTQLSMMLLAFVLAGLTLAGLVQPWHIIALAFLLGVANAFDAPARISFVLELVDREDITNAVALNGTMFNGATAIGPAAAGLTYAALGPAWCFVINGMSFLAVIAALLLMKVQPRVKRQARRSTLEELREGLGFVVTRPVILTLISLAGVASLFGLSFLTLLPAWAVKVLGGDAATNGLLQSARGVGALIAALAIASLGRFQFKGRLLTAGTFVYPLLLLIFAMLRWVPASLLGMLGVGLGVMLMMNLANALVQTSVPDELRGRVVSVYTLTFFGLMPVGALLAGWLAQQWGEPAAVRVAGLAALAYAAFVYWRVPQLRAMP